jgi:hypothetical protein
VLVLGDFTLSHSGCLVWSRTAKEPDCSFDRPKAKTDAKQYSTAAARLVLRFLQRSSLFFQPRVDHRASSGLGIIARSENCPLLRQPVAWSMNGHAPLLPRDPLKDRVANPSVLHRLILGRSCPFML